MSNNNKKPPSYSFTTALSKLGHSLLSSSTTSTTTSSSSSAERQACILTLLRILDNILKDPSNSNPKLRKIKVVNPGAFWKRAGRWDGAIDFLVVGCGFVGKSGSSSTPTKAATGASGVSNLKLGKEEDRERLLHGRKELIRFAVGTLGMEEGSLPSFGNNSAGGGSVGSASSTKKTKKENVAGSGANGASGGSGTSSSMATNNGKVVEKSESLFSANKNNDTMGVVSSAKKTVSSSSSSSSSSPGGKLRMSSVTTATAEGKAVNDVMTRNATSSSSSRNNGCTKEETDTAKGISGNDNRQQKIMSSSLPQSLSSPDKNRLLARREKEETKTMMTKTKTKDSTMNGIRSRSETSSNNTMGKKIVPKNQSLSPVKKPGTSGAAVAGAKASNNNAITGVSSKSNRMSTTPITKKGIQNSNNNTSNSNSSNQRQTPQSPPKSLSLEQIQLLARREREETDLLETQKLWGNNRTKAGGPPSPQSSMLSLEQIQSLARKERNETCMLLEAEKLDREKVTAFASSSGVGIATPAREQRGGILPTPKRGERLPSAGNPSTPSSAKAMSRVTTPAGVTTPARERRDSIPTPKREEGKVLSAVNPSTPSLTNKISSSTPPRREATPIASGVTTPAGSIPAREPRDSKPKREDGRSAVTPSTSSSTNKSSASAPPRQKATPVISNTIAKMARLVNEPASPPTKVIKKTARVVNASSPPSPATRRREKIDRERGGGGDVAESSAPTLSDEMTDLLDEIASELNDDFFNTEDNEADDTACNSGADGNGENGGNHREERTGRASVDVVKPVGMPVVTETVVETEMTAVAENNASSGSNPDGTSLENQRVRLEQRNRAMEEEGDAAAGPRSGGNRIVENGDSGGEPPMKLPEAVQGLVESSSSSSSEGKRDSGGAATAVVGESSPADDVMGHSTYSVGSAADLLDDLESRSEILAMDPYGAAVCDEGRAPVMSNLHAQYVGNGSNRSMLSGVTAETGAGVDRRNEGEAMQSDNHPQKGETDVDNRRRPSSGSLTTNATTDDEDDSYLPPWTPWTPPDESDPYTRLFRGIPIPEGELDGDEDVRKYRHGFELCHRALLAIWTPAEAEDAAFSKSVKYHYKKVVDPSTSSSCVATGGLANLRRVSPPEGAIDANNSEEGRRPVILVPLAFVYTAWVSILGLSDDLNGGSGAGIQSGKMYSWVVSNDLQLSAFDEVPVGGSLSLIDNHLPEAGVAVCNYICKALRDIGLACIYEASASDETGGVSDPAFFVGVERSVFKECLRKRGNNTLDGETSSLNECHNIMARLVYPRILGELGSEGNDHVVDDDQNKVMTWYSCHHAIRHLAASGSLSNARSLLSESQFIRLRLRSTGLLAGSHGHCRDCTRMDLCLSRSVEEWQRKKGSSSSEDRVRAPHDISEWKEDHFEILCSISTVLREKAREIAATLSPPAGYGQGPSKRQQLQMDIGDALQSIGECISDIGVYRVEEKEHYEEALQLKSEAFGGDENHEAIGDILYIMGCHHQRFHHFKFAQKCYEQALRIYKVTLGYEHLCVARVLHNIGIMYHAKRDNGVALKCLKKSLSIRSSHTSTADPSSVSKEGEVIRAEDAALWLSIAESHCWIGKIRREKKNYTEARVCFTTAHRIKVAILGKPHLESAEVLHNVGIVCDDLGLHSQSLSCFREALLIRLANVSGSHDIIGINDVCETLDCIGNVYRLKEERQKALQFFEQCLKRRVRVVSSADGPPNKNQVSLLLRTYEDVIELTKLQIKENADNKNELSQKVGTMLVEMGTLFDQKLNKQSKALTYLQKALQEFQAMKEYNWIGDTLSLIGVIHVKKSANQKALKCFRDSLVMRKLASGKKETAGVAETFHHIGNCEAREGQFEDSLKSYKEALRIKKSVFHRKGYLSIAKTEHCMGLSMLQLGNLDDALESFEASIKVRRALLGDHLDVAFSLHSIGRIFFHQNNIEDATACLEEAMKLKLRFLPEKHMSLAETQHLLASLYIKKQNYSPAVPLLKSALLGYKGTRDCDIMKSDVLDLLGDAYAKLGEDGHSLLSYEHSLKIKKVVLGKDGVACANVLMEIGKLKSMKNDIDGALFAFKEVKRIQKILFGKNHLKNADLLIQVGLIQDRLGNYDMAARCFAEALRMRRKLIDQNSEIGGNQSSLIAEALVHTGRMHQSKCDHLKSLTFFKEAIDIYRKSGGDEDVSQECANACRLLGLSQIACGDNENALPSLARCLELRERTYGTESEQWAEIAYDLGIAKCQAGIYDDALVLLDKCVLLLKGFETSDPERLSNALLHLGKIYLKKRSVDNAMVHFDEALVIRKKLKKNEIGVSEVLFQIGGVRELKKQYLESLVCYEESLKLRLSVLGEDEDTADIISRIGEVRRIRGQYDLALENFTLALDMYKNTVGETHLSVANTYHSLGYVCDAKNDAQKAMQNHKEGLSVRKLILGGDHVKIAASLDDVAGMYQKQNEQKKALKCLTEALRIRKLKLGGNDIEIGKTLFGMGIIFAAINDSEMAMDCYSGSLEISSHDGSNPKLEAQTLHQIGCVHAENCNYKEALQNWRTCLSKYREGGLRDDHYMVACTLGNIEMAENVLNT